MIHRVSKAVKRVYVRRAVNENYCTRARRSLYYCGRLRALFIFARDKRVRDDGAFGSLMCRVFFFFYLRLDFKLKFIGLFGKYRLIKGGQMRDFVLRFIIVLTVRSPHNSSCRCKYIILWR